VRGNSKTMEHAAKTLQCIVVTPERAVLDQAADFVALPMYDGELGVLPGRAPLIGRLGSGELRLRRGNTSDRYFIDGGFAQVRNDQVTVLTQQAIKAEAIDQEAATRTLDAPLGIVASENSPQTTRAKERARAQLRIARKGHEAGHA
jgi:F-type H+-transporting ATPase subunit epsilon